MARKRVLVVLIAVSFVLLGAHAQFADVGATAHADMGMTWRSTVTKDGVELTLECPKKMFCGSKNYVTMTVRNNAERTVFFTPMGTQRLGIHFEVTQHRGPQHDFARVPLSTTAMGKHVGLVPTDEIKVRLPVAIEVGHELRLVVNLTRYYDLSVPTPDRLQIRARWRGYFAEGERRAIDLQTESIGFELSVKPGEVGTTGFVIRPIGESAP